MNSMKKHAIHREKSPFQYHLTGWDLLQLQSLAARETGYWDA